MVPEDSDIVVRQERHDGRERFVLTMAPEVQIVVDSLTNALEQAVAFGRRKKVRVWLADGAQSFFSLVASFREKEIGCGFADRGLVTGDI
jgi:hypothetical protein